MKSSYKKGLLKRGIELSFAAGITAAMLAAPGVAWSQATSGSIFGQVTDPAHSSVVVKNLDTGLTREVSASADGHFTFAALPPGNYTVTLSENGTVSSTQQVFVSAGAGTPVSFSNDSVDLATVVVSGSLVAPIDVTSSKSSTIFSAEQLDKMPVAKDITSVALLAPGTVKGDSSFGNLASFGGSSVAENAYYINGFNVTNLFKNLSYSELPFYAIGQDEVYTGGYGAEYGLSTGGVMSITTKKGTNQWQGGAAINWEPDELRASSPNTRESDGTPFQANSKNSSTKTTYDVWLGGPIIKDKLFFYAIGELEQDNSTTFPTSESGNDIYNTDRTAPFFLGKIDWHIDDNNLIELTGINDTRKYDYDYFGSTDSYSYGENFIDQKGDFSGSEHDEYGGNTLIAKYTGNLTDNLTLEVQGGTLKSKNEGYLKTTDGTKLTYNGEVGDFDQGGCPVVVFGSTFTGTRSDTCWINSTLPMSNAEDKRSSGSADLEYRLFTEDFGSHTFKGGYATDKWESTSGESYSGGGYYYYGNSTNVDSGGDYVRVIRFQTGADVKVDTDSFYVKDDWQITPTLMLNLGIRNDSFKNKNGAGETYVQQKNIWQPRLGFAWDVTGDSTKKLYGSYGLYSLPITASVAVRGASASIYSVQYWEYSAIDPTTGEPTLTTPVDDPLGYGYGDLSYQNNENGQTPDASAVATKHLDSTMETEYILGYEMEVGQGWKAGIKGTYRNLNKTIDDMCDWAPIEEWADENGVTFSNTDNVPGCFIFNPGYSMDLGLDLDGDGTKENIHLTPDMIGEPKAKRKYYAIDLTLEKQWDRAFFRGSYTWSHNYGNTEGLVKSDIGQADTGTTQDFDFPALMVGSYGDLPNDRRHQVKLMGSYDITNEITLGAISTFSTGRPKNCFGYNAEADEDYGYGASYFYCNGEVVTRGSKGRTDNIFELDLSAQYKPSYVPGLMVGAAVMNVFNNDSALSVEETGEDDAGESLASYNTPTSFQEPRYVRLTAEYQFGK